jgi:hypothetical protein
VEDEHCVIAARGDVRDHGICALPQCQVLAVTEVVFDIDKAFSGISICEHQADTSNFGHTLGQSVDLREGSVVGDRLVGTVSRRDFVLDGSIGADEVREVSLSTTPTNTEGADITAMVSAAIWSERIWASVFANDSGQLLFVCEWQGALSVLKQDCRSSTDVTDKLSMLLTDINMLVDDTGTPGWSDVCVNSAVCVGSPWLEVR